LTGDAFQWYLTLPSGSVKTLEDMQRFFVLERDVCIADLLSVTQKPNETAQDDIKRWRQEANKCHVPLSEEEQIKLCRKGLKPEIALPLSEEISKFQQLATNAHSKERLIIEAKRKEASPSEERQGNAVR
jgi:hypothetical protein